MTWFPILLVACQANRVSGTIQDQRVPVGSAWSVLEPGAFGLDDLLVVSLASIPSACRAVQFWQERQAQTDDPAELALAWAAAFPEDWWQVDLVARVEPGAWPEPGSVWPALPAEGLPERSGDVFASFTHHVRYPDEAWLAGETDAVQPFDQWLSDGGAARWSRVDPASEVHGRFHAAVVDGDGALAGDVELFFRAGPCPVVGTSAPARIYSP